MFRQRNTDRLYLTLVCLLILVAFGSLVLGRVLDSDWIRIRPGAIVLSLVVAFGLGMRAHAKGRLSALGSGLVVVLACGIQLLQFVLRGDQGEDASFPTIATQSYSAGMFCIGSALVLDVLLPARWGRHLLFGFLGAISALIGAAGIFAAIADLSTALDANLLDGMRLPGSSILLLAGLTLLMGARLRIVPPSDHLDSSIESEELKDRSGLAAALAVLFLTLGATLLVWRQVHDQTGRQIDAARSDSLQRFAETLQSGSSRAVTLLNGLRGLFAASENVNQDEWFQYFNQLQLADQFAGFYFVAYAADIEGAVIAKSGKRTVIVDGAAIEIWPVSAHPTSYPTVYVLPRNRTTTALLGLDLAAVPVLAQAISKAGASGRASASGRIDFGEFKVPEPRSGFIVVLPLARHAPEKGANFPSAVGVSGFVYCALDVNVIVRDAMRKSQADQLALRIVDDADTSRGVPIFQSPDFDARKPSISRTLDMHGRRWLVNAHLTSETLASARSRHTSAVLVGGLMAALILFVITWVLTGNRARALHLAGQINRQLGRAQLAQQAVTDTASAGIITADHEGKILYMNPAAATAFGVDAGSLAGSYLTVLMPERFREPHTRGLQRIASGAAPRAIGNALELAGLRSDGSEFPIEILLSAWQSEDQMFFTAFVTDITERKLAELELKKRAQELERSNADLEQFAYVASHDLQEPLRMVASYVQLLARRYRGKLDSDADEFIGYAADGATRMQKLIEDLLAYAQVGRSGMVPVPTYVRACAQAATMQLQESVARSAARIFIDVDCSVLAVPAQLTQVFQNLIANALKFHGADPPEVTINALREGTNWHILVADNGIGIAPKHWERVFAIFQRLHTRTEYSGTGIGLAICRRIIESFGGRIWVESEPGVGSVFHFVLPESGKSS